MTDEAIQARLRACDAVVAWCLRNAERREASGALEHALVWAYVAAMTASQCGHSWLCSAPLESLLARLGRQLSAVGPPARRPSGSQARWLHVLSITTPIGGHTALARRWIARNPPDQRHAVVVTAQPADAVAPALADAAHASGGFVTSIAAVRGLTARAAALRRLAYEEADVVVLHVHPWDVLPAVAFAVEGGPVVLLMNHADHAFWAGCAVADRVLDFRDSGAALTAQWRVPRGSARLPVPLEDRPAAPHERHALARALRDPSRAPDAVVLLTVGRAGKYRAHGALDFAAAVERIVAGCRDCALIAIGPQADDPRWSALAATSGGRVVAIGEQADLRPWHAAADIYLEGFPVGSYTALLEAAQAGRAIVRKPLLAPPELLPIDRGALADFAPPDDPVAYADAVLTLAGDPARRRELGMRAREAVHGMHWTDWPRHLAALCASLPARHEAGPAGECPTVPGALAPYVARMLPGHAAESPLEVAQEAALQQGLQPRADIAVIDAVRAWRAAGAAGSQTARPR